MLAVHDTDLSKCSTLLPVSLQQAGTPNLIHPHHCIMVLLDKDRVNPNAHFLASHNQKFMDSSEEIKLFFLFFWLSGIFSRGLYRNRANNKAIFEMIN